MRLWVWASGVAAGLAATNVQAQPLQVAAPWFACSSGAYAVTLPRHYPSLHGIGRHQVVDLGEREQAGQRLRGRRIEYMGMQLDLSLDPAAPQLYALNHLSSTSRRWHIGALSVGRMPWRTSREPSLAGLKLDGALELVGARDRATLMLDDGRIRQVQIRCG